jgi:hypothetical protein
VVVVHVARLLIVSDSSRFSVSKLAGELASMGNQVTQLNLDNEPFNQRLANNYDLVVFTAINPYTALSIALTVSRSINDAVGMLNSLSVVKLLKEQGIEYELVAGDEAVKRVFTKGPYYFNTAWSLGLGGFVDTVEGARSILEYRHYLKNPLSLASVLAHISNAQESKVFATVKHERYGEVLRRLNVQFAELTIVNGVIVEANPTPEVPLGSVREVAEVINSNVK